MSLRLSHHSTDCTGRCHLRLLSHTFTEVSGWECGIALRYHPGGQVRNKVQAFQCHDTCSHKVACREKGVLQISSHCLLTYRDCRQVFHLYAKHNVEQKQDIKSDEVEHRTIKMYRQIPCQPFGPSSFPFGQEAECPLYRSENREHSEQDLLAVNRSPLFTKYIQWNSVL